ncbi:MAG: cysteine desulfurase [Myxococcales bacterium]|nr:cysteine desulfurase [Myxococcales bacterium]
MDPMAIRADFPTLHQEVYGHPLVYLDNAASAQTPQSVIDAIVRFYQNDYSNVHRGVHRLSQVATDAYEAVRRDVKQLLNAADEREIIFTKGTTESINLVASSFGERFIGEGDEILITAMEHHANIVPWQLVCERKGARLRVVPIDERGELLLDELETMITPRTKLVAVVHISNALGTVNPVKRIAEIAHRRDVPVLVDGAQSVPHQRIDVQELDCDFFAFSGHKVYGPTGVGVLYGKSRWLEEMPPYQGGGDMILKVTFERTTFADLPNKFEAGTPNIAGVIGLGAALEYLQAIGVGRVRAHEDRLLSYATESLGAVPGVRLIGTAREKAGVLSFVVSGIHPHDIGTIVDRYGVAIRVGHHCAQPVMRRFDVAATARASFAMYNTFDEVDVFVDAVRKAIEVFS